MNPTEEREWRANLQEGEEVVIQSRDKHGIRRRLQRATVERATKTQVTADGRIFLRRWGNERGHDYYRSDLIRPPLPQLLAEIEGAEARRRAIAGNLHNIPWGLLHEDVLDEIWATVQKQLGETQQ